MRNFLSPVKDVYQSDRHGLSPIAFRLSAVCIGGLKKRPERLPWRDFAGQYLLKLLASAFSNRAFEGFMGRGLREVAGRLE